MAHSNDSDPSATSLLRRAVQADLDRGVWPSGKIPSLRVLAERYGLSRQTIYRALRALVAEGVLERRPPGRGYWVRGSPGPPPRAAAGGAKQRLCRELRDRVLRGDFHPDGMLPLQKSLQDSYRIGHGTVRTALSALAAEGLIERAGSRYRVARPLRSSGGARSVHIVGCGLEATATRMDPWTLEIIAGVEHHVRDLAWEPPRYVTAERTGEGGSGLDAVDPGAVAGYIAVQHWGTLHALRATARAHQLPYVVVDPSDSYTVEASRTFAKDEPAFWLCTDNRAAGHAMGAHLRARGHRRIAFISQLPPPRHRWIECRLAGLSDFFAEIDGGMTVFTRERPRESLLGEERAMLSEIKRLRRFYAGRKGLPAAVTATVTGDLFSLNSMLSAAVEAEPLFEAALARKDITAWVCCNDDLALIAREYLLGAGVRPGRDIALAGFDNTLHARASDITSYDFALRTLGYAAVQCLVRPHFFPPAARGVKRIQGGLVGRGST